MRENQKEEFVQYREIAVLTIVPCIVGILILTSWALAHWAIGPYFLNAGLALIATLFGGFQRFIAGFKDIYHRRITVNVFVTVALVATVAVGEFRPAAIIVFIMAVAGAFESYTLDKSRKNIRNLLDLTPRMATVRRGEGEVVVPVNEVQVGDVVIARRDPVRRVVREGVLQSAEGGCGHPSRCRRSARLRRVLSFGNVQVTIRRI
jgi:Cd2+/Zn2+-exporting ATPase